MKICHLGKYYPPYTGGIETYVHTLAQAQAEAGAEVEVYCLNHEPNQKTLEELDGKVRVTRFRSRFRLSRMDFCPELIRAIRELKADVVHLHVPNPAMIVALLLARSRLPVVVTYQSDHVRQRLLRFLFRPIETLVYRGVRAILATSPNYFESSSFLQGHRDRVRIVPMGIRLSSYLQPTAKDREKAREIRNTYPNPLWLSVARLTYYKGLENAVRALPKSPGTLLIIGDGEERGRLEREARDLGVRERIVFLGANLDREEVVPYYLAADALWFPSNARSEAFGLVQVEAMASGCPVINTRLASGVPWVSQHESTGLTIPINDPDALAEAAIRVWSEPELRQRLSTDARIRASTEFDYAVMTTRTFRVYEEVLGGPCA